MHIIKPSADDDINSLELFDKDGEMVVQIFGKRKPGRTELLEWKTILAEQVKRLLKRADLFCLRVLAVPL